MLIQLLEKDLRYFLNFLYKMRKASHYIPNKTILKYLILVQFLLLGGLLLLLNSYKKETTLKSRAKNNSAEIKRLTDIGDNFYFDTEKMDSAYSYYNKSQLLCNPQINCTDYVYALSSMADIQHIQGDYIGSEVNLTKTLPYLKKIKKTRYAWFVYNLQGLNYHNLSDYNNALNYLKKALHVKTTLYRKSFVLNNIATVYMSQHKYKKAIAIFLILIKHPKISKYDYVNNSQQALLLDNLGYCYFKTGNNKALDCYNKSLKLRLQGKEDYLMSAGYYHFSKFYQKTNPLLAKKYAELGYKNSLDFKNVTNKISCLSQLIESSNGNELKKYSLIYIKLIDSVNKAAQTAKNQFSNIKYDSKVDKQENLQLKAQKAENELQVERQKKRNIICSIIIVVIFGLIIILYFRLTSKARKEKNEAIYKSEMQISRKLHDELANDVYQTLAFAQNRDIELTENKNHLLNNLQVIYSRARNISKENSTIITNENYSISLKEMISEFNDPNINLLLNGLETISWNEIEKNKKITVYRVLQELLVNTKKHSNATLIGITFKTTDKIVTISYTDNGNGFDLNKVTFRNGIQNIENRILAIKGEINIDSALSKGFKVIFKFPL
jgi:signal transduction histidine kinase